MAERAFAQAAAKNAAPILEVLRREFRDCRQVLEIGSGTGQHAVAFASDLEHLDWQTSDLDENHGRIEAWVADSGVANVRAPLSVDVRTTDLPPDACDGVYSSNTAHIMSMETVLDMFTLVARALRPGGVFCLYGPFTIDGRFNTRSNEQFDQQLRARDASMGLRDLVVLEEHATRQGLKRDALYAMPTNNLLAVWRKESK